ncbi:YhcH/YjgK/YiaL family protein [Atopobiaceae bacterium 24-176]
MISASINAKAFGPVTTERIERAMEWCRTVDPATLELGRNDIDGDDVFANVMRFDTTPADTKDYEAHCDYIDIHYVFSGVELMGIAPVKDCTPKGAFDEENDFVLVEQPKLESWVVTQAGEFCLTPPADAHKPGCCLGAPTPLFKACVKVRIAD